MRFCKLNTSGNRSPVRPELVEGRGAAIRCLMDFHVYILKCRDNSFYTGHTDDLGARMASHQAGSFDGYTRRRRPVELVFCETFPTRIEALERERQIKGWSRAKKRALIERDWQRLCALSSGDKKC